MEYYKNLDLADIKYFCVFDNIWKTEQWKYVVNYEGFYQVSDLGRIKSISRNILRNGVYFFQSKGKILKQGMNKGYLLISLYTNGTCKTRKSHQLVAEAFLNHKPCGLKLVVNHKNFIRTDNRVENLEIVTQRENANKKHLKSTSKYVGVFLDKRNKKWVSMIYIKDKLKRLGYFTTELEASKYYENALKAHLNNEEIIVKQPNFTSKYKGVAWHKRDGKWTSVIVINGKTKHLGYFKTEIEAHEAYKNELSRKITRRIV